MQHAPAGAKPGQWHPRPTQSLLGRTSKIARKLRLDFRLFGHDVAAAGSEAEQFIALPRGVPVYVTYLTLVPTSAGMGYFEDRYGWDRPGVVADGMDTTVGSPLQSAAAQR